MSESIEQVLGATPGSLAFLEQYSGAERDRLLALFEQARELQRKQVDAAIESGLQIVPAFLRKTVRKALGDKG